MGQIWLVLTVSDDTRLSRPDFGMRSVFSGRGQALQMVLAKVEGSALLVGPFSELVIQLSV